MTEREAELLPCPFCGHIGLGFQEGSTFRWLAFSCGGCGVGSEVRVQTLGHGTKEEWWENAKIRAIEEWNERAPEVSPKGADTLTEALTEMLKMFGGNHDGTMGPCDFCDVVARARAALRSQSPTEASPEARGEQL